MNTLDDLRHTLDQHSHDASGLDPAARRDALGARITSAKRRRNAVRGGLVAATVVAVAGAVTLPMLGSDDGAGPAGRTLLGQQAPATVSTYDNTYRFLEGTEDPSASTLDIEVGHSDETRILTWATAGDDQDVRVDGPWEQRWDSSRADFDDWVTIPEGFEGTVTVTSATGSEGLGAALYAADPTLLPDVVEAFHGQYFRAEGPTTRRVGLAVGERGETELSFPYRDAGKGLSVVVSCKGVPAGLSVNTEVVGSGSSHGYSKECQGDDGGAGDGAGSLTKDLGLTPGHSVHLSDDGSQADGTARVWISRSVKDLTPLDPADYPEARLAAAAYTSVGETQDIAGVDWQAETIRWEQGHLWRLDRVVPDAANQSHDIADEAADAPILVQELTRSRGGLSLMASVRVDGEETGGSALVQPDNGTSWQTTVVAKGSKVVELRAEPQGRGSKGAEVDPSAQTLLIYRLVP